MSSPVLLVARGVVTLDQRAPAASSPPRALLIDRERIAWVAAEPSELQTSSLGDGISLEQLQTVDLGDAWITPAFVDAHVHSTATGLAETGLDLSGCASAADCLERLRLHAAAIDEQILFGRGWESHSWPERRPPSAAEISAAAPGRTVVLLRVDAHSCVVDEATLARLPLDGLEGVDRDAAGAPTGWLREQASEAALTAVRAALPLDRLAAARQATCRRAASLGIACLHEMGHPALSGMSDALAWAAGDWGIEVLVWWAELAPFVADPSALQAEGLRPGGDLFLDGSIGSRTAAVSRGYADGGHGQLFNDDGEVAAFFTACTSAGRGAGVHAIGDRAIEQALDGIEAAAQRLGLDAVRRCRHRIEHVELVSQAQLRRLARLGAVASVQPAFDAQWGGPDGLYAQQFGVAAALASNPLAEFARHSVTMAFGSDSTVTPLDPWGGVAAAESHRGGLGIDRVSALRAHTIGGRWAAGQDDVGPLAAGMRSDFAVWDRDPLTSEPRALECLATVVRGAVAHGDLPALEPAGHG